MKPKEICHVCHKKPAWINDIDFVELSKGGHGYGAWMRFTPVKTLVCLDCYIKRNERKQ